jgi:hypothetical protein
MEAAFDLVYGFIDFWAALLLFGWIIQTGYILLRKG